MGSIKDIKILLLVGYALGYPLAVLPPIFLDPLLKSHVMYPSRNYAYACMCLPIFLLFFGAQLVLLRKSTSSISLYISVCVFLLAIILSLPIFLPEFPHGNLFAVGSTMAFLSAFTIFVWSIGDRISTDLKSLKSLKSAGDATFEYMKALFSFVRQGAFAGVALFGALFFAAFTNEFKYAENTVSDKSDMFFLNLNFSMQIASYAIYSVVGPVRYFFIMNLQILAQFKDMAIRLDGQGTDLPEKGR